MADGHLGKCKACTKGHVAVNREKNKEYYLEYDRNRPNKAERVMASLAHQKTETGVLAHAESNQRYREKYPEENKARYAVSNALRVGALKRPNSCECCGGLCRPEGHHPDYNKPLDVVWLCIRCHKDWHLKNEPIYVNMS